MMMRLVLKEEVKVIWRAEARARVLTVVTVKAKVVVAVPLKAAEVVVVVPLKVVVDLKGVAAAAVLQLVVVVSR
jgi:hypothetical protein